MVMRWWYSLLLCGLGYVILLVCVCCVLLFHILKSDLHNVQIGSAIAITSHEDQSYPFIGIDSDLHNTMLEINTYSYRLAALGLISKPLYNQVPVLGAELDSVFEKMQQMRELIRLLQIILVSVDHLEVPDYIQGFLSAKWAGSPSMDDKLLELTCEKVDRFREEFSGFFQVGNNFSISSYLLHNRVTMKREQGIQTINLFSDVCHLAIYSDRFLDSLSPYVSQVLTQMPQKKRDHLAPFDLRALRKDFYILKQNALLVRNLVEDMQSKNYDEVIGEDRYRIASSAARIFYKLVYRMNEFAETLEPLSRDDQKMLVKAKYMMREISDRHSETLLMVEDLRGLINDIEQVMSKENWEINFDIFSNLRSWVDRIELVSEVADNHEVLFPTNDVMRFLVLGQSADELRATGGFVSGLWLLTVDNAETLEVSYYDVVEIDNRHKLHLYPEPPLGLKEHMGAWVWLLRDVSWYPHFPTTAEAAMEMFKIGKNVDVDGVIAVNQWALLEILKVLGPTEIGDTGAVDAKNIMEVLESKTDKTGRYYAHYVLNGVIDQIDRIDSSSEMILLLNAVMSAVTSKDLIFYFTDNNLSRLVNISGADGNVNHVRGDYLYVVDSNVGWSKSDRNMERDLLYQVDLSDIDNAKAVLDVSYVNHSTKDGPGCEPQWVRRGNDYRSFRNACYWNYLRLYLPKEVNVVEETFVPLPEYSVSAHMGTGEVGQHTGSVNKSGGLTEYSVLLKTEAGGSSSHKIKYELPSSVIYKTQEHYIYELKIQKQPGVKYRDLNVSIHLPQLSDASIISNGEVFLEGNKIIAKFDGTEDFNLVVKFKL